MGAGQGERFESIATSGQRKGDIGHTLSVTLWSHCSHPYHPASVSKHHTAHQMKVCPQDSEIKSETPYHHRYCLVCGPVNYQLTKSGDQSGDQLTKSGDQLTRCGNQLNKPGDQLTKSGNQLTKSVN